MSQGINPKVIDLAILAAAALIRHMLMDSVTSKIADKMYAEGRRIPNAEEKQVIAGMLETSDMNLDEALRQAEAEGR